MYITSLYACVFFFIGAPIDDFTSYSPSCHFSTSFVKLEHNYFSSDKYYFYPTALVPLSTTPYCETAFKNITSSELFRSNSLTDLCSNDIFPSGFDHSSIKRSRVQISSCVRIVVYSILSHNICDYLCIDSSLSRFTIYNATCVELPRSIRVVDHSGFGSLVSSILHAFVSFAETIIEVIVLTLFHTCFSLVLKFLDIVIGVLWAFHPGKLLICGFLLRPHFELRIFVFVMILVFLFIFKLN